MSEGLPLVRGTLDILVLRVLEAGPRHGYDVVSQIADRSGGEIQVDDGALYQSLHRMREKGWIAAEWGHAESGKRARFYELTPEGRARLGADTRGWLRYSQAVTKVLESS
jgi:PadR family transcriptional regulator PadR